MIRGWIDRAVRRYGSARFRRAYFRARARKLIARIDADRRSP
jgi:hypothetical protein